MWLALAIWADKIMLYAWKDGSVRVVHRPPPRATQYGLPPFGGGVLYIWQPDFESLWPTRLPDDSREAPTPPPDDSRRQLVQSPGPGRRPALMLSEIKQARALVRQAARERRRQKQKLKIKDALTLLQDSMERGGKPIVVSDATWKAHVIWPVLCPDKK